MSESGTLFRSRGLRVRLVQYKSLNLGVLPIAGLRQKGLTSRQSRDYDRCIVHITWVAALDALHVCFIALVNRLYGRHLGVLMQQGIDYSRSFTWSSCLKACNFFFSFLPSALIPSALPILPAPAPPHLIIIVTPLLRLVLMIGPLYSLCYCMSSRSRSHCFEYCVDYAVLIRLFLFSPQVFNR